ncbi:MAG: hypothetical protein COT74_12595 [Bdellovibrionales bacterium CG10_big_fil_rev_8_21_14_0_10_45_34]|nr:MAG: hypothetical protein COT74_12595 [Bdellovibrionales bacterium CG10_big_fil_rev_8_21_14_0_10_45_34]
MNASTKKIESRQNAQFKYWRSLTEGRGLKKGEHYLVAGSKLVNEYLASDSENVRAIIGSSECGASLTDESESFLAHDFFDLSSSLFEELDVLGARFPLLLVSQSPLHQIEELSKYTSNENCLVLPLSDPSNLGACLRSAKAFGFKNIVLCAESANPFLPKCVRTLASPLFGFRFFQGGSFSTILGELDGEVLCLDLDGEPLQDAASNLTGPVTLVVGEEGKGFEKWQQCAEQLLIRKVKIAHNSSVESLNATVAVSIALWEISKRLN